MTKKTSLQDKLSVDQYHEFRLRRNRVLIGLFGAFVWVAAAVLPQVLFGYKPSFFMIATPFFLLTVWLIIQLLRFKCPVCETVPMVTRPSFGTGEVAVTGFVALFPKKCLKCGVRFALSRESKDADC